MPEMCKLVHNDYDRISDKVMWLGYGVTLNFNVDLFFIKASNNGNKTKENFHREYLYKINEDDPYRVKIVRDFIYYFSIELTSKNIKDKVRISIGPEQVYSVIFNLKRVMKWFIGEDGVITVFQKRGDKLIIPTHPEPIRINLAFNKYIEFEPAIDIRNGYETIGVRVYLNNDGIFFFMSSDVLFSLTHMLSTCNMYALAQSMLNYIGRPEYGTNSYNLYTGENTQNKIKKMSYFDMVGAKSE